MQASKDNLLRLTSPLGQVVWEAELTKREQGTSQNKAQAFVFDEVLGPILIYEDVMIPVCIQ